jgi:hypothetical protein
VDLEYWAVLAALVAAGAWGFAAGFRWWRWARLIEDTPTSRVRSAAQGYVELAGRGRNLPGEPVIAPLSRRPCTWWSFAIEQRVSDGRRRRWQVINHDESAHLFAMEDESGMCVVDPEGADVLPSATDRWHGDAPFPVAGPPPTSGFRGFGSEYRYRESRMHDGDPLYAIGFFRTETGLLPGPADDEVAALLRSWKRDQAGLLRRFDADRDGSLSLGEWERARAAAHAQVTAERTRGPAPPGVHVLEKPADGDRPFLLAAASAGTLARRYRLRALLGLAAFLGATFAATWLVLHPGG